jgi:hypothetical protein
MCMYVCKHIHKHARTHTQTSTHARARAHTQNLDSNGIYYSSFSHFTTATAHTKALSAILIGLFPPFAGLLRLLPPFIETPVSVQQFFITIY